MINQWQPVPVSFEALHEPDETQIVQSVQAAVLDYLHQLVEAASYLGQRPIHRRRR